LIVRLAFFIRRMESISQQDSTDIITCFFSPYFISLNSSHPTSQGFAIFKFILKVTIEFKPGIVFNHFLVFFINIPGLLFTINL